MSGLEEIGLGVFQLAVLLDDACPGQGQAAPRLHHVGLVSAAGLGPQRHVRQHLVVRLDVLLGKGPDFPRSLNFEESLDRAQRN